MSLNELIKSPVVSWMAADGPESDIVITSRIRLARNLARLPFPQLMSEQKVAEKVWETIRNGLKKVPDLKLVSMSKLSDMERQMLLEKHLISPEHAEVVSPYRGIITNKTGSIAIMVNEEDHLRIQCLLPAMQLNEAWSLANIIDDCLEQS